jgi:hypothetical protein
MGDFFPRKYAAYGGWFNQLVAACAAHKTVLGLSDAQITAFQAAGTAWGNDYLAFCNAQAALGATAATMRSSFDACVALAREINRLMQANPAASAALKAEMGLPIHDTRPTRAPVAATRPLLTVDTSQRLQHKLKWRDETTPQSHAKPKGMVEAQIWSKIGGAAPVGASECHLAGTSSKSSLVLDYAGADAGKPAYYMARWKNAHNEFGPWSETVVATISA